MSKPNQNVNLVDCNKREWREGAGGQHPILMQNWLNNMNVFKNSFMNEDLFSFINEFLNVSDYSKVVANALLATTRTSLTLFR